MQKETVAQSGLQAQIWERAQCTFISLITWGAGGSSTLTSPLLNWLPLCRLSVAQSFKEKEIGGLY